MDARFTLLGRNAAWLLLIMKLGPGRTPPDAMEPDIHGVRTHWILGSWRFWLARRSRIVRLMVSA